jgi:hypothetical protein
MTNFPAGVKVSKPLSQSKGIEFHKDCIFVEEIGLVSPIPEPQNEFKTSKM